MGSGARAVAAPAKLDTKGEAMWRSIGRDFTRRPIGLASLLVLSGAGICAAQDVAPQGNSASAPAKKQPAKKQPADTSTKAKKQQADTSIKIEIYGFTQGDMINDFKTNNPDWFDVNRPSRLPAFTDEFGHNGHTWLSARQSRFGAKATIPTSTKPITVVFDWDLFGVGVDAGQTTIRPRHMYGQWGVFGAGQTESPFMDLDVFPNILEYWGPNGMLFFRNVQFFYEPINEPNGTRAIIALERPGASGDAGLLSDRVELQNILAAFPRPRHLGRRTATREIGDTRRSARSSGGFGGTTSLPTTCSTSTAASPAGACRSAAATRPARRTSSTHRSSTAPASRTTSTTRRSTWAFARTSTSPLTPVTGKALPDFGDGRCTSTTRGTTTSRARSATRRVDIDNSNLQLPEAFKIGQYASTNLLWTPVKNVLMGGEFQWGYRQNHSDGFHFDDLPAPVLRQVLLFADLWRKQMIAVMQHDRAGSRRAATLGTFATLALLGVAAPRVVAAQTARRLPAHRERGVREIQEPE